MADSPRGASVSVVGVPEVSDGSATRAGVADVCDGVEGCPDAYEAAVEPDLGWGGVDPAQR